MPTVPETNRGPQREAMLFSDVDGTLLDGRTSLAAVRASWLAATREVEVVLASSRTVEELVALLDAVGGDGDVIAENGCCIAVRSPRLARALGAWDEVTHGERRWHLRCRGVPADTVLTALAQARATCGASVRFAHELSPEQRAGRFDDAPDAARIALARRCSVLVEPPPTSRANDAWLRLVRAQGHRIELGGRWLAIWRGPDKGEAVRAYLAARDAVGATPRVTAAVGDGENDASMLRVVSRPLAVRQMGGRHDPTLRAVPRAEAIAAEGHVGWRVAIRMLAADALAPATA